jgi:N-acetylglutamate synthase-like GNAT family acetyltransferase
MEINVTFRLLKPHDQLYFMFGTELIRNSQGKSAVGERQLEFMAQAGDCCVFGAFENGDIVGVASGGILPPNQFEHYAIFSNGLREILNSEKVGMLLAVAVRDDRCGYGIGRNLLQLRKDWLKKHGARYALASSWSNGAQFSSPRLFEADGFEKLSHYCSYTPPQSGINCPKCHHGCRCENFIFIKEL